MCGGANFEQFVVAEVQLFIFNTREHVTGSSVVCHPRCKICDAHGYAVR